MQFHKISLWLCLMASHFALNAGATPFEENIQSGIREGNPSRQILFFQEALTHADGDPAKSSLARFNRGIAYYEKGQFKDAEADFSWVLERYPENYDAQKNKGLCQLEQLNFEGALKTFREMVAMFPETAEVYFLRGNAYMGQKNWGAAIKMFRNATRRDPHHLDAMNNRGWAFYYNKQYAKALEDFDRVLSVRPGDSFATEGKNQVMNWLDRLSQEMRR
jgi:tetratricopeptide (TPR) repeat protein